MCHAEGTEDPPAAPGEGGEPAGKLRVLAINM
jgi:hypothetical protein